MTQYIWLLAIQIPIIVAGVTCAYHLGIHAQRQAIRDQEWAALEEWMERMHHRNDDDGGTP